ncbi:ROK family protein [Brevibacillus halotolerans]|uniref:ROK family protein n=1 Tax=Brevibacillus TaxID=55080 RepID=UPI00215C3FA3|nr:MULTISPECIES: ROK family protein [Brevibacillus]MCR8964342.1 ROK family protein [Brevibacillus laterosporus]MCZ0836497.1 ROK family protein [Brevibacillus halotolerans]
MRLGAVEAGGTKFVCAIGNEFGEILERSSFPTTTPQETLEQVITFLHQKKLDVIGIGSFGPIDLNTASATYGYVRNTPKLAWRNYNVLGHMKEHFSVPIAFDTDVNAAALGEATWGAAKGLDSCIYMTVGTGIGVGAIVEGKLLHGMSHPEMGHILVKPHHLDSFTGVCPYHGNCLEGMASGPAIEKRWNQKGAKLQASTEVWELEAYYLAQALMNYVLILAPKRLIIGGGVMKQEQLFPLVRQQLSELLQGYVSENQYFCNDLSTYIVPPALGDNAGVCGALALAKRSLVQG